MTEPRSRRALLLDRDGTIIEERHYLCDADGVVLLPGAAAALRDLAAAGFPAIVCTNQSGIARGLISLAQYRAVRLRMDELLSAEGAAVIDTFTCPHHPEFTGPCSCRKPGTALYERAAAVHDLALARCVYVGDRSRDVVLASVIGARGMLIRSPITPLSEVEATTAAGIPVVASLTDAAALLLANAT